MYDLFRVVATAREYAVKAYSEGKAPPSHGLDHVVRVVGLCRWLAREMGLGSRETLLLEVAAWLHDIAIAVYGSKEKHAERSAEIARRVLEGLLAPEDLEVVITAIREHSWRGGRKPSGSVSAILQDADRLDALGAVGLFRVFAYSGGLGRAFYHPDDPFAENRDLDDTTYTLDHFFTKLLKLADHMNTEPARIEAERRTLFMKKYLEELRRELAYSSP